MFNTAKPEYLCQTVDKLRAELGETLIGVVLYGSHARGEAREGSDVDLLVIARNLPERRYERTVALQRMVRGIEKAPSISILGKTPEEFERHFPSLYLDIGLDGKTLFDRAGYTESRLKRIREIIAQAGLERETLANGDMFWNWNRKTGSPWEITWEGYRELA